MAIINIPGLSPSISDLNYTMPIGISVLGTVVVDDITFPSFDLPVTLDDRGNEVTPKSLEVKLQTVKVTVVQSKNIVETSIAGRNGTVKEYIADGDYNITIEGKINEALNVFPEDQMINWIEKCKVVQSIPIISKYLNKLYGINTVVVKSFTSTPVVGSVNEVDISMELVSDNDFDPELFLVNPKNTYKYRSVRFL